MISPVRINLLCLKISIKAWEIVMRIGSTIFFAVAAISISETFKIAMQVNDRDQVWLATSLAIGALVTTIVCAYVGFRLFRKGM